MGHGKREHEHAKNPDPIDKGSCGLCRANGLQGCKGHIKSGGGSGEETATDKRLSKTLYELFTKSQLWAEDYDDDMLFYWHNPDSLISITADIGSGLMNISGTHNVSESNEQAQAELFSEITKELEQFKKELGLMGNTVEFMPTDRGLNIRISDKTQYDAFVHRLMDRNLLITDTVCLKQEIKPSISSKVSIDALKTIQEKTHIPGIATAVLSDGVIRSQSVGVMNAGKPKEKLTDATVFEAASLSKPVFAYIVLKLAQKGQIDLDKPLYEYYSNQEGFGPPQMRVDENYKKLTARMVLSHQAGLPNEFTSPESQRYISEVGEKFDYSGVAYQFLGEVVEWITSKSLETLAQEEFVKIGMGNSSFMPPAGCCLIKLPDAQEPTPQFIQELLKNTSDRNGQISIIYHQGNLYVAERENGQVKITQKDPDLVTEEIAAVKGRFAEIPNNPYWLSKPIPIEARELSMVTAVISHRPEHAATIAIGHFSDIDRHVSVNTSQRFYVVHPGGSLYTTASDYAKFLNMCIEDPYISKEMFQPTVPSLKDRDTKAQEKNLSSDVLEQMSWGIGIGLQTNPDGSRVAFHWGDNGTGRNLAAINLNTGKAIVCLTNSSNGSEAFLTIAEPIVGNLRAIGQWLSIREDLPMSIGVIAVLTADDTSHEGQQGSEPGYP